MPTTVNHTIDDISPLITYIGSSWHESTPTLDPLISQYSNGTFTLCSTAGSYATFSFNGTAIWIFGAKRPNHATYSVTLDSVTTQFDGRADPAVFQVPLFGATELSPDHIHTVTIMNLEDDPSLRYLDIDFITWTTIVADSNAPTTVIHTDEITAFSYHPSSAWLTNPTIGTSTSSQQASAVLTFVGDEMMLYVGPSSGIYTISLDNAPPLTYNASKINPTDQVPLYHASKLGGGVHTLNVTNSGTVEGSTLGIDYAVVRGSKAAVIGTPVESASAGAGGKGKSGLTTGAMTGIAAGAGTGGKPRGICPWGVHTAYLTASDTAYSISPTCFRQLCDSREDYLVSS